MVERGNPGNRGGRFSRICDRLKGRLHAWASDESGVSLVELIVALTISSIVLAVITTAIVQFYELTRWGNARLLLDNDFQTANLWLGRDAAEANTFSPGTGLEYGTFNWADGSNAYRYSYDPAQGALVREHLQGGSTVSTLRVARHVADQADISFSVSGQLVSVSLTLSEVDVTETRTLTFTMRAE